MIDKEQVLALTQGGRNVFSHYLGFEVNLHKNFRSPFYEDKRASCHIYYDRKSFMIMATLPIREIAFGSWPH